MGGTQNPFQNLAGQEREHAPSPARHPQPYMPPTLKGSRGAHKTPQKCLTVHIVHHPSQLFASEDQPKKKKKHDDLLRSSVPIGVSPRPADKCKQRGRACWMTIFLSTGQPFSTGVPSGFLGGAASRGIQMTSLAKFGHNPIWSVMPPGVPGWWHP